MQQLPHIVVEMILSPIEIIAFLQKMFGDYALKVYICTIIKRSRMDSCDSIKTKIEHS